MIPGQKVLIHGAAGGIGSFAVQFAKSGGLLVAATCRTANVEYVRSLGADRVIDYKTEDVCQAVRDWSAEGVDVVLDAVGPATLPQALDMLRPVGRLVNIITATADGDIEGDRREAERRGVRKVTMIVDFDRARQSMRENTHLIDSGLGSRTAPRCVSPGGGRLRSSNDRDWTCARKTGPHGCRPFCLMIWNVTCDLDCVVFPSPAPRRSEVKASGCLDVLTRQDVSFAEAVIQVRRTGRAVEWVCRKAKPRKVRSPCIL